MSEELPEGWAETSLGEVADVVGGGTPPASDASNFSEDGGYPWLTPADLSAFRGKLIGRGARNLTEKGLKACSARLLPKNTVLMSSRAPIGYLAIAANPIATNQGFKSFVCSEALHPDYLFHWLAFMRPRLEEMASGTTFLELSGSRAKEIPVRIPPLPEQKRIVEKVEALLAKVQAARDRLERVQQILKRFRQSVLAAECGAGLGALPSGWRRMSLGELGEWQSGGTPSRREPRFYGGSIPWLKSGELRDGLIERTEETISQEGLRGSAARMLPRGTVCIAMYGATIGRVGMLGIEAATNQACANCIVNAEVLDNWFLFYYLLSQREAFVEAGQGGAQPNISQTIIRAWPINLPPRVEQAAIVNRIQALLGLADSVDALAKSALCKTASIPHSILAAAFSGELVVAEAALALEEGRGYESGEALLERVRGEAASAPPRGVTNKTKRHQGRR